MAEQSSQQVSASEQSEKGVAITLNYPIFPEAFAKYLPEGYTLENLDAECMCYECAPKLWDFRFRKPSRHNPPTTMKRNQRGKDSAAPKEEYVFFKPLSRKRTRATAGKEEETRRKVTKIEGKLQTLSDIKRSCDYRKQVARVEAYLEQLTRGLTHRQLEALRAFKKAYAQFCEARSTGEAADLPKIHLLCRPLDDIFFDGSLSYMRYLWHDTMGEGFMGDTIYSPNYLPKLIRLNRINHMDSRSSDVDIITTILHELVHAFIGVYFCNGKPCISEKKMAHKGALCEYMSARCFDLVTSATISNDEGTRQLDCEHWCSGHGPIFQSLLRSVHKAVGPVFDNEIAVEMSDIPGERLCKCSGKPSRCAFHCSETYDSLQLHILGILSRENREKSEEAVEEEGTEESQEEPQGEEDSLEELSMSDIPIDLLEAEEEEGMEESQEEPQGEEVSLSQGEEDFLEEEPQGEEGEGKGEGKEEEEEEEEEEDEDEEEEEEEEEEDEEDDGSEYVPSDEDENDSD